MGRRNSYILVTFLIVFVCMAATIAQGQANNGNGKVGNNNGNGNPGSNNGGNSNTGNNNGNGNTGNNNGNGNTGNNNGNSNTGNNNGNSNTGNSNGNGNTGNNNGNSNTGSNNGNGNTGNNNGNGNTGTYNGNGNTGNNNGNGNTGNNNGSGNTGNNNGNGNTGSNNGNGNTGNNNGNNNTGNNNGNDNTGNNNGNGNTGNNNGNGNTGNNNGNSNTGSNNGNGNTGNNNGNGNTGNNNGNGNTGNNNGNGNTGNNNGNSNTGNNNGNGNNGNNNGNGNTGNNNGNINTGNNNGNGNTGNNNGNNNTGNNNGNGNTGGNTDAEATNYDMLTPLGTGRERAFCKSKACHYKTLVCPAECPERKPKHNKKNKGCFINCGSKCEATCKFRKAKCDGYGSLCYDPRFVGGDGVMFYFHGAKGGNFAIVSDNNLHINAHFIGTRPAGRTRDYTWVQALAIMFDTHTLVIAANKVKHWDDNVDALLVRYDGEAIQIPTEGEAEWITLSEHREVIVERTDDVNNVRVVVSGLVEINVKVREIGREESKVHNYQLPEGDAFAHLETQFKFSGLSDDVEGVLGKTYRPDYVSPVKRGVPMPMMGGEDKYQTTSLYSTLCKVCRFQHQPVTASI